MKSKKDKDYTFFKQLELDKDLETMITIFDANNIDYKIDSAKTIIDENIVGKPLFAKYTIKLQPKDFGKANALLEEYYNNQIVDESGFDHLKDLSNDELMHITFNPQDWSIESAVAAKHILKKRKVLITDDEISKKRAQLQNELKQGKRVSPILLITCGLSMVIGLTIHFSFAVVAYFISFNFGFGKSTDANGLKYFTYDTTTRNMGQLIFFGGIVGYILVAYLHYEYGYF